MEEIKRLFDGIEPFYILVSTKTAQPFLMHGECYLFTDRVAMEKKQEYLGLLGYGVTSVSVSGSREVLLEDISASGADTVVLDDQDFMGERVHRAGVNQLTPVYPDDATSETVPLVNRALCRLLNEMAQEGEEAGEEYQAEIERLMGKTHFLAPINHAASAIQGSPVFPTMQGTKIIPVFTDYRAYLSFMSMSGDPNTGYDAWLLSFDDMKGMMKSNPAVTFQLNPQGIAWNISP